jgi:hypothetical protein
LAKQNGETLTRAVNIAIRQRLERQKQFPASKGRLEKIRKIVEITAPLMKDGPSSKEFFDELYDEYGLPK